MIPLTGVLQADLWDDAAEALKRMFGERVGRWCAAAAEIAAGETDLAADRVRGQADEASNTSLAFAARKRRIITSRMIASQAVCTQPSTQADPASVLHVIMQLITICYANLRCHVVI